MQLVIQLAADSEEVKQLLDQACRIVLQAKECDRRELLASDGDAVGEVKIGLICMDNGKPLCEECDDMGVIVTPCDGEHNGD